MRDGMDGCGLRHGGVVSFCVVRGLRRCVLTAAPPASPLASGSVLGSAFCFCRLVVDTACILLITCLPSLFYSFVSLRRSARVRPLAPRYPAISAPPLSIHSALGPECPPSSTPAQSQQWQAVVPAQAPAAAAASSRNSHAEVRQPSPSPASILSSMDHRRTDRRPRPQVASTSRVTSDRSTPMATK
jgi:hypothetical protein